MMYTIETCKYELWARIYGAGTPTPSAPMRRTRREGDRAKFNKETISGSPPDFKPERQMIERLRRGEETPWDIRFYHHGANEAQMCVKFRGLPPDDALRKIKEVHDFLDRAQGGDVRDRYHPDVIFKDLGQFR